MENDMEDTADPSGEFMSAEHIKIPLHIFMELCS